MSYCLISLSNRQTQTKLLSDSRSFINFPFFLYPHEECCTQTAALYSYPVMATSRGITTEHFTAALAITHIQDENIPQQNRVDAEQYLMLLRSSPEGLNLAFHIISNEEFSDIRCFWAFNTIIHHLPELAVTIDSEQSIQIYSSLFSWLLRNCQGATLPDFILNKHAQTMVVGIQEFYPSRWQNVFEDLFSLLYRREQWTHARDHLTMYFLRIFEYIDERVVCVRSKTDRAKEQRQRDMEVKDAMRELVIANAVNRWYQILCEYRVKTPEVAKVCLDVVQTYVEWIDINFMITPEWMNLFYFFTTVPYLRQGGCECLFNIVEKKQLPQVKMDTIAAMGIVEALPKIVHMVPTPSTEEEEAFLLNVVTLANGVACQILQCIDAIPAAAQMIHLVVPEVLKLFSIAHFQVRELSLPFVQQYIKASVLGDEEAAELLHLIYRHTVLNECELAAPSDDVIDQRKMLHNLIRLLYRRFPAMVVDHCSRVVYQVVSVVSWEVLPSYEAEGALRYLYELGENIRMDILKDPNGSFSQMIYHLLHCAAITQHGNSFVHLAYFELMDRYSLFFVHHRDQVPHLLNQSLLMPCGILNLNDRVRSRVCYLFGHMVQQLKLQFAPHAESIVKAMKEVVERSHLTASNKLDLYESIGTMLTLTDANTCVSVAENVVKHMHSQHSLVESSGANREACSVAVADDIAFLSHLAKGVVGLEVSKIPDSPPLVSKDACSFPSNASLPQDMGDGSPGGPSPQGSSAPFQVFWQVSTDVMRALELWSNVPLVRDRACLFMHQMVNILSQVGPLAELFEAFVSNMLQWICAVNELPKIMRVVYQFVNRTRSMCITTVSRMIPVLHQKVLQVGGDVATVRSEMGVVSEYTREQGEVFKSYFSVLHAVVHSSCLPALVTEPTSAILGTVLEQLVVAIRVSAEFELPKQALQILSRLTHQLAGEHIPFTTFLLRSALPEMVNTFTDSFFDLKDAKNYFLISEFCQILKSIVTKLGDSGLQEIFLMMTKNSVMCLAEGDASSVCQRLKEEARASTQFKNAFRGLLETVQQRRNVSTFQSMPQTS